MAQHLYFVCIFFFFGVSPWSNTPMQLDKNPSRIRTKHELFRVIPAPGARWCGKHWRLVRTIQGICSDLQRFLFKQFDKIRKKKTKTFWFWSEKKFPTLATVCQIFDTENLWNATCPLCLIFQKNKAIMVTETPEPTTKQSAHTQLSKQPHQSSDENRKQQPSLVGTHVTTGLTSVKWRANLSWGISFNDVGLLHAGLAIYQTCQTSRCTIHTMVKVNVTLLSARTKLTNCFQIILSCVACSDKEFTELQNDGRRTNQLSAQQTSDHGSKSNWANLTNPVWILLVLPISST